MTTTTTLREGSAAADPRVGRVADSAWPPGRPELSSVPVDAADVSTMAGLASLPGLAARLARMAAEIRMLARNAPVWAMGANGLGDAIEQAQAVREVAHNLSAVLAAEVDSRGLATASGLSRNDWVAGHAPGLAGGASAALTAVGAAMNEPRWSELSALVRSGSVSVDKAAVIVRFHRDVERVADPVHLAAVVDSMVEGAEALGLKELRRLVSHARASLRPPKQVDDDDQRMRAGRCLTKVGRCAGMTDYLLRMDPEGSAILDAAIDPLARPRPDLDWSRFGPATGEAAPLDGDAGNAGSTRAGGAVDPRPATVRRADALLELIGRAVSSPEGVARTPRTKLVVTMSHEALVGLVQGAGVADNDEVLSASTVRRLACEAEVIPMVLGAPSEVLDLGMTSRFFTPAQRLALTRRDGGCSYPGCTVPPQWCDAHHVVPWSRGGATDLCNGALLCGRHHTIVHQLEMTATVTLLGVEWHVPDSVLGSHPTLGPPPTSAGPASPRRKHQSAGEQQSVTVAREHQSVTSARAPSQDPPPPAAPNMTRERPHPAAPYVPPDRTRPAVPNVPPDRTRPAAPNASRDRLQPAGPARRGCLPASPSAPTPISPPAADGPPVTRGRRIAQGADAGPAP